jgi:hypothetical protein
MAQMVLIHGIAQEQRSADDLEAEWLPALAGGLRVAGYGQLADRIWRDRATPKGIDARMAFYGNKFLTPGEQGGDPDTLDAAELQLAEQLALAWLERARTAASLRERQAAERELDLLTSPAGQAQGVGTIKRSAIAGLVRVPWFGPFGMAVAERFVRRALAQVTRYFSSERIREHALEQVAGLLDADTQVVVGHSLGSVVAYEASHRLGRPLPLLVTLGSPLGLRRVVYERLRPQPPSFPPQVKRWVNVADRDDAIAAAPNLGRLFGAGQPPTALFEGGWTADNGAKPHTATFYLTKEQTGRPIGQTLSAAV